LTLLIPLLLAAPPTPAAPPDFPAVSSFVLQVTPLQARESFTVRVSADGLVERWNASGGRVSRVGSARMLPAATAPVVELAGSVPLAGDMGDGVREGDIYVLATSPAGGVRAFLEPLAPKPLRRLVGEADRLSRAIDLWPATDHYLRAVPVTPERAAALEAAGLSFVAWDSLGAEVRPLCERASESLCEFIPVPAPALDAVLTAWADRDGRDPCFELEDSSPIQIGLWSPE